MIGEKKYALRLVSFQGDTRQNQFVGGIHCPRGYGKGSCPSLSFYTKGFGKFNRRQAKTYITKCKPHGIELAMVELEYRREPGAIYGDWFIPGVDI